MYQDSSSDESAEEREGWLCKLCGVRNKDEHVVCRECKTLQETIRPKNASTWFCAFCEMPNNPDVDVCEMCLTPNPDPLPKHEAI